jgi:hypothetical protein
VLTHRSVSVIAVQNALPVKSVNDLIALAKAKPGQLNYGSGAFGGAPHLAAELFKTMAAVNITRVDYKGIAPALTATISGEVQMCFCDAGVVMPQVKSGLLRALAVTSLTPSVVVPGVLHVAWAVDNIEQKVAAIAAKGTKVKTGKPHRVPRGYMTCNIDVEFGEHSLFQLAEG